SVIFRISRVPTSAKPQAATTPASWLPSCPQWPSRAPTGLPSPKMGLTTAWAKNPVSSAPTAPPAPCTPKASSAASQRTRAFTRGTQREEKGARHEADHRRRHGPYDPRRRGDGHQAGDGAGDGAERAGLAVLQPLRQAPAEGRGGRAEVRGHEGARGQAARR